MSDTSDKSARPERRDAPLWRRHLPLEHETAVYVLLSALDVFMTYLLLRSNMGRENGLVIYESNPVARFFLHSWGMRGMIYFKFAMVAFVCVVTQVIAARRLETARRVLKIATVVVAGVVIYSLILYLRANG